MICTKCSNTAVLNTVMGKDFFYCRTCKIECLPEKKENQSSSTMKPAYDIARDAYIRILVQDDAFESLTDWCTHPGSFPAGLGGSSNNNSAQPTFDNYDFKVGDIVECVDNTDWYNIGTHLVITVGKSYKVVKTQDKENVFVIDNYGISNNLKTKRFKLKERK